jgi:LCP family protein required for cell wall assembly
MTTQPSEPSQSALSVLPFWRSRRFITITAVLALSAGIMGASLALFLRSKPFQKRELTPEEAQAFNKEDKDISQLTAGLPKLTRPVHVLILGTVVLSNDHPNFSRPDDRFFRQIDDNLNGQSDAILLVRLDPDRGKVTALSIPRDTRADIPGLGVGKINSANFAGGIMMSALAVSKLLGGVQIDRFVRVNVTGFNKLIDALGGVEIYVPKDMKYQDDSQHLYINLKAGKQILNGEQAVQYMRFRQDDLGDIGRVQRQQAFIRALIQQKLTLETVVRLPEIFEVLKENLDTNLTIEEMLAMANFAAQVGRENTNFLMLPGRFSTSGEFTLSYWLADEQAVTRLMTEYFDVLPKLGAKTNRKPTPATIRIAIQDSRPTPSGSAQTLLQKLTRAGYPLVSLADNKEIVPQAKTQIIAQSGDRASALLVQKTLGVGEVVVESTGVLESDVTIRIGQDWQDASLDAPSAP